MATTNSKPEIMSTLSNETIVATMPYRGKNSLDGWNHPSILVLKTGKVVMPVLKIAEQGKVEVRKFAVLGHLVPSLEDGGGLFLIPTNIARQLEINLETIASKVRSYRMSPQGLVNESQTANRSLVINISL